MSAQHKILTTVGAVFVVGLWPREWWLWHGLWVMLLIVLSGVLKFPFRVLMGRWLRLWLVAGLVALGWIRQPDFGLRAVNLLIKCSLGLWIASLLVHTTSIPQMVEGLRRLRLPAIWTETIAFWARYTLVLGDEWRRLQLARQARVLRSSRALEFKSLANALGLLFLRAYERAERVHRAMLARGYREGV